MSVKNKLVVENYEMGVKILESKYKDNYEITDVSTKRKWVVAGPKRCEITYSNDVMKKKAESEKISKATEVVAPLATRNVDDTGLTQAEKDMMDEMASMKEMFNNFMQNISVALEDSKENGNGLIGGIKSLLVKNGVTEEISNELIKKAINSLHPKNRESKNHIIQALRDVLLSTVKISPGYNIENSRSIVFVGPTGVGKTTTLAKTAKIFQEKQKKVALVTLDTYKLGAIDQIDEYAKILQVPVDSCKTKDDLHTTMIRFMDKDCIFVDTMGHSPKDIKSNTLLKSMIDLIDPSEVTLVMSANMKTKDLFDCVEQFKYMDFNSIIMTKLDETNSLGEIINVAYTYPKYKMVYFTTGQGVPEDIEVAKVEKLLVSIMNEEEVE